MPRVRRPLLAAALLVAAAAPAAAQVSARFEAASDKTFSRPHDVVLSPDRSRLYVSDLGNDAVKVLDPSSLETVGTIGADELASPHDVAFDPDGRLLVADTGNDRIAIYEVEGDGGRLVGEIGGLAAPEGVVAAPDGRIYLTNVGTDDAQVYKDGKLLARVGPEDGEATAFQRPHDIDLDPAGNVYVSDPGNNRIQVLSPELMPLRSIGGPPYDFHEPKYFAINEAGWLFVADEYNHQIKILDDGRAVIATIGSGEVGEGPDRFNYPEGVEVLGDTLWVADTRNGRIVRYRVRGLRTGQGIRLRIGGGSG